LSDPHRNNQTFTRIEQKGTQHLDLTISFESKLAEPLIICQNIP